MILRKPYAFLIKYFKLIHMILFAGILYVTIKNISITNFIGSYLATNLERPLTDNYSASYTSTGSILVLISIIVLSAVVLYLMRHKNKPVIFYIINIVVYTFTLLLFLYTADFLYNAQFSVPDFRFTKIIKDICFTLIFIQIGTLILTFIRMTGFDIKKFNFQKDLIDFDLSSDDREEFEFQLNVDTEDIKAQIRKRMRILKYNYQENKLIFLGFFGIIMIIVFSIVLDFFLNIEWKYKEGETFTTSAYKIEVMDSYKTFNNARGEIINQDKFYVVLKLKYQNIADYDIDEINVLNAKIKADDFYMVEPNKLYNTYFPEFGENYYSQTIKSGETKIFTFVYELDKKYYDKNLNLRYLYDIIYEDSEFKYKYRTVKLRPKELLKTNNVVTKKLNEEIIFKDSILGNTKLNITNVKINQNFTYKTNYCHDTKCISRFDKIVPSLTNKYELSVMRIDYNLSFDRNYLGDRYRNNKFFETHGNIRFKIDGKEYNHKIALKDITPYPTSNFAFVEVRARIEKADNIYLDLMLRDKIYTYILK